VAAVDGLVSGLDTTTIVSQLMSLERGPQTRLKTSLSAQQADVTAYQAINTKMAALQTAADKVALAATWTQGKATSSSNAITATAGAGAVSGSVTFSVTALAKAGAKVSAQTWSSTTDTSAPASSFQIRDAKGTVLDTIAPADGSLASVVAAVNTSTKSNVRAAAVQVADGQWKLQLTAKATGTTNDFTLADPNGDPLAAGSDFTTVTTAADAKLHVGDAAAGYDITSAGNTVEGVLPGVTLKVSSLATDVRVDVDQDTASITAAVQALVDAANAAITTIGAQTRQGSVGKTGPSSGAGALAGDPAMRALAGKVVSAVTFAVGGASAGSIGIQSTRDGALTFDATKFGTALAAKPDATRALLQGAATTAKLPDGSTTTSGSDGVAVRLAELGKTATRSTTGTLATAISSRNRAIDDLNDRIAAWDDRLAARQKTLQAQYSRLEVALGKLKSQSTWLSGQLASLPTPGSDS
jgi:flagellar hook-associated protein 2